MLELEAWQRDLRKHDRAEQQCSDQGDGWSFDQEGDRTSQSFGPRPAKLRHPKEAEHHAGPEESVGRRGKAQESGGLPWIDVEFRQSPGGSDRNYDHRNWQRPADLYV